MSAVYNSLSSKAVFITGGASGIGAAFVAAFARQGANVTLVDVDTDSGEKLVAALAAEGCPKPLFITCDVTQVSALQAAVEQAEEAHGPATILVNNVANDARESFDDVSEAQWHKSLAVNLDPAFFASQAVVPGMRRAGGGAIIHVSSINALFGPANMPSYITAKAGLLGLTKSMARDLGKDKIRVNCIVPGWIITEKQLDKWLTPEVEQEWMTQVCLQERIYPEEVANLALFLAADESRMITSQQFVIDGGRL